MATVSQNLPNYPFFLQAINNDPPISYSANDFRDLFNALLPRTGLLSYALRVSQGDNVGMNINVRSGYAVVGEYLVKIATTQSVNLASISGSPSTKRTHKVYLAVYDRTKGAAENSAKIVVSEDPGTGAPTPSGASAYTQLATLSVSPNQGMILNAHITMTAQHSGSQSDFIMLDPYLATGIVGAGNNLDTNAPRCWVSNGAVHFSGPVKRSNFSQFAGGSVYTVANLTSNLWPSYVRRGLCPTGKSLDLGTFIARLRIDTAGTLTATIPDGQPCDYIVLDGFHYELD